MVGDGAEIRVWGQTLHILHILMSLAIRYHDVTPFLSLVFSPTSFFSTVLVTPPNNKWVEDVAFSSCRTSPTGGPFAGPATPQLHSPSPSCNMTGGGLGGGEREGGGVEGDVWAGGVRPAADFAS